MAPYDHDGSKIPRTVTTCTSCLAWGLTRAQGVCLACYAFATPRYGHAVGECGGCRRQQPLKKGYCRLCWCQAALDRIHADGDARSQVVIAPHLPGVGHHQLFLAGMTRRKGKPRTAPRRYGEKGRPLKPPPPMAGRPRTDWLQPPLFEERLRPDYRYRHDLRKDALPDNRWLTWALHLAHTRAEAHGWSRKIRQAMQRNLVMLLSNHITGEVIHASAVYEAIKQRGNSVTHTLEILQTMGVVLEDRPTTFDLWLQRKLTPLAPGIAPVVQQWACTLRDGGPRTRARRPATVGTFMRYAHPALVEWSARYDDLRQVTRDDVLAYLAIWHGTDRTTALVGLRSLFTWARKNQLIFANPTAAIKGPRREHPVLQPLAPEDITRAIEAATTPQARVFLVLVAVHAARPMAIRGLQLHDIDLGNRRLTIAGLPRPLDDLTHQVITDWLEHRQRRWPNTANRHLLISAKTAVDTGPVHPTWMLNLRGLPATLERLRIDRQLEEALTHGADPLHLTAVFGIDESTAIRYAASARQLLQRPHESRSPQSRETRGSTGAEEQNRPSGSR